MRDGPFASIDDNHGREIEGSVTHKETKLHTLNGRDLPRVSPLVIANHPRRKAPALILLHVHRQALSITAGQSAPWQAALTASIVLQCQSDPILAIPPIQSVTPSARSSGAATPPALNSTGPRALNCTSANFFSLLALYPWTSRSQKGHLESWNPAGNGWNESNDRQAAARLPSPRGP